MVKPVTSKEVARRAQVSQSTVSRVFSTSSAKVAESTRLRVLAVAEELGYHPNAIARMMSTNLTHIVGIVMATVNSPFYPYVLEKFLEGLQDMQRHALLFTAAPHQSIDDVLPLVLQHRVDALIITSATLSSEMADECSRQGIPVILFNRYVPGANASAVCADNVDGGRQVADLLLDTGHRNLAYIAGTSNTSTNTDRQRGFLNRLHQHGYRDVQIAQGDYSYETGAAALSELLNRPIVPDAIFCANDIMALGAMDRAREAGLRIPEDLSIIGFDDIPMASWGAYDLTTIRQEVDLMIAATFDLMTQKLADPDTDPVLRMIPGSLCVRGSVRGVARTHEKS